MNKFEKGLLTIFFIEIFVGGGGRLIDFGVLSIRQVLFFLLILTFVYRIIKHREFLNKNVNSFIRFNPVTLGIYVLIGWFFISAAIGYINGHSLSVIITDIFRVSFFAVYFPLAYYISEKRYTKQKIINLLKKCALVVAIFTIVVSLLGKTIFSSDFYPFYKFMNTIMNDDLFFRPSNSVFYKSHFFVLIGLILSLNALLTKRYNKIDVANIILCSISVIWSETRGFLLAFIVIVLVILILDVKLLTDPIKGIKQKLQLLLQNRHFMKKTVILLLVIVSLPFLYQHMTLQRFDQGDKNIEEFNQENSNNEEIKDVSINARIEFIIDSKNILLRNPKNFIFGTGYGTEIAGRTSGIEMSFLDILVEQGAIGLAFWCFLFFQVIYNFYIFYKRTGQLTSNEISLISAFVGILLLTNINPFINNPIGISFFLVLLILSQNKKESTKISQ
jgi:hypothetical protein